MHVPEFNLTWELALQFDLDLGTTPAEGDVFPLDVELPLPVEDETLPLIGAHPSRARLWIAAGHEGHGVTTAPATAELIAALMTGATPPLDPAPYRVQRLLPQP